jgi:NitT/TauT family transport system permease protein
VLRKASEISNVLRDQGISVLSIFGLIAVWQTSEFLVDYQLTLPSFLQVVAAFTENWWSILTEDLPVSSLHFAIGMVGGLSVALPVGMIMGWFKFFDSILDPIVEILRPIPPLAWIPFAIIWFGITNTAAGFIIFIGAVFPILINTYVGFKSLPRLYVESAKVLGATKDIDLIRYVALPFALPSIAAGIRIAMGIAWMCLVAAEMFGVSRNGLGFKIWDSYGHYRMDEVFMYMIVLGLLGLAIDRTFRYVVEDRMLKWRVGLTQ